MIWIIGFVAFVALIVIGLWIASEFAHARAETAAMRQFREAVRYLKKRNNG
jgi:glucose uptake protein GlcU